jgi:hypothetical protein
MGAGRGCRRSPVCLVVGPFSAFAVNGDGSFSLCGGENGELLRGDEMWDAIRELGQAVREALRDWPGTLRLLCVLAAVTIAVMILR